MNRLLACTAVGLFLGLAPAVAETQAPAPDQSALDQPGQPSEATPAQPATPDAATPDRPDAAIDDPSLKTPGQSSEMAPEESPPDQASPPSLGEAAPAPEGSPSDQGSPPSLGEAAPAPEGSPPALGESTPAPGAAPPSVGEASPPASSEEPKSAEAAPSGSQFLLKQDSSDWLVGNLIGKSVVNADDESIGSVTDLVTDQGGKIIAVVVGAGGFLGIGQKDVAIRFEDIKLARDENNDIKVMANIDKEILASAPDYETLDEQQITVGEQGGQEPAQ